MVLASAIIVLFAISKRPVFAKSSVAYENELASTAGMTALERQCKSVEGLSFGRCGRCFE